MAKKIEIKKTKSKNILVSSGLDDLYTGIFIKKNH